MPSQRVLVTGGAGFIGSHLAEALLAGGRRVVVYDNLSMGRRNNVPPGAELVEGDVRDVNALTAALQGVDAVFHLAARVSIRDSLEHFAEDAEVNLLGTVRLLEACVRRPPRKLILASSMAVYADSPQPAGVTETYPTDPISPYGIAKLAAERYVLQICPRAGTAPVVLRYFNTFGPRQTPTPYVGVITIFVRRLLDGLPPIVYGDGAQCRDFVHVSDIVQANLRALDGDASNCVINVGTGVATSVKRIAELLCARINPSAAPQFAPPPPGELQNCVADITQARHLLGYEPRYRLEDKIDEVIEYLRGRQ